MKQVVSNGAAHVRCTDSGVITVADAEDITREVVDTVLGYLAEELEKTLAGEVRLEEVLQLVHTLRSGTSVGKLH